MPQQRDEADLACRGAYWRTIILMVLAEIAVIAALVV